MKKAENRVETYLSNKYQKTFSYVSEKGGVWSDKATSVIYKDPNGVECVVRYTDKYMSDNYCSALYDGEIAQRLRDTIQAECKVFVSTESAFFGESKSFASAEDYLKRCGVVNITIYVPQENLLSDVAADVQRASEGSTFSGMIQCVSRDVFHNLSSRDDNVLPGDIVEYGSFWIEDGVIVRTSWEA